MKTFFHVQMGRSKEDQRSKLHRKMDNLKEVVSIFFELELDCDLLRIRGWKTGCFVFLKSFRSIYYL